MQITHRMRIPMAAWHPYLEFPHGLGVAWPLVAPEFPIAICWSHKSANTTMLKWFLFHLGLLDRAQAEHPDRTHLFWHAHTSAHPEYGDQCVRALAGPIRKFSVKVIRDPADRAVSCFVHFIRDPKVVFLETWDAFLGWKWSQGLPQTPDATFTQFLRFVLDSRANGKPLDHHLQPQWHPAQDRFVMRYIPLETIGPNLRQLEQLFGLRESPLEALSHSPHHSPPATGRSWPANAADVPLNRKLLRQLGGPRPDALLNDTTRSLISAAFAEDYTAYERFYSDSPSRLRARLGNPSHTASRRAA